MRDIVFQCLSKVTQTEIFSYPELDTLYAKLATFAHVSPENLLITNGSDGAIRSCFETCVSPGDKIILTRPTFAMYSVYSDIYEAKVTWIDYAKTLKGPYIDADHIVDLVKKGRPKLVCLPNPDSPTGTVFPPDKLRKIVEAVGEVGALMLIDEAYHPLYSWTAAQWIFEYEHLAIVRSFNKAWGQPGFE